jgi:hypothetical protein
MFPPEDSLDCFDSLAKTSGESLAKPAARTATVVLIPQARRTSPPAAKWMDCRTLRIAVAKSPKIRPICG